MNSCLFIGNVGRDADLRYGANGTANATFSLAVNEPKRGDGTREPRVLWVSCVVFGHTAESLSQYLVKGRQVAVRGALWPRTWTDDAGVRHERMELVVDDVQLLGGRASEGGRE